MLTRITADALCTVIALGYLKWDNNQPIKSNFLYEDGTDAEQAQLRLSMLNSTVVEIRAMFPYIEREYDKRTRPFIIARQKELQNDIDHTLINENLSERMIPLETTINEIAPDGGFKGAYIGGIARVQNRNSDIELYYPSLLYQYNVPGIINVDADYNRDVQSNYRNYLYASERIIDAFYNMSLPGGILHFTGNYQDLRNLINGMPEMVPVNRTIASVHGLVTSMTLRPPATLQPGEYNIEYGLSYGTNKIASCLPCAIFAASQGRPASYTHFGRGDYWNLPENCNAAIRQNWAAFILNCYDLGLNIIRNNLPFEMEDFFAGININRAEIPQNFLYALTFQSSFISKMRNTIASLE